MGLRNIISGNVTILQVAVEQVKIIIVVGTPLIGVIDEFELQKKDFLSYLDCIEQFLKLNAISEDKKVPLFLTVVGAVIYGILKSPLVPDLPSEKLYAELVSALRMHFSPKLMVIAERYNQVRLSDYIVASKKLAKSCDFKEFLNDSLWDRFVCAFSEHGISSVRSSLTETNQFIAPVNINSQFSKKLAKSCDFKEFLNDSLWDRFVCAL
ncbi:hypothetical protein PR048_015457 [Dryococelus australis]|uniref:Uncharacterized protein n=1 Tax=Dryococelus australis TaxID=614101 RepID=A0ABQ9HI21_9NEOP|nr:hypothetical protein PR048_015457 [Dryococelus australis]